MRTRKARGRKALIGVALVVMCGVAMGAGFPDATAFKVCGTALSDSAPVSVSQTFYWSAWQQGMDTGVFCRGGAGSPPDCYLAVVTTPGKSTGRSGMVRLELWRISGGTAQNMVAGERIVSDHREMGEGLLTLSVNGQRVAATVVWGSPSNARIEVTYQDAAPLLGVNAGQYGKKSAPDVWLMTK